jgi:putative transposase
MKRNRFSEEQIIGRLRDLRAGGKAGDLARKDGVSDATLYNWKAKFGGIDVLDAKRLRALGEENNKLIRRLAETMLDNMLLKELLLRNGRVRRPTRGCRLSLPQGSNERASGLCSDCR